MVCTFVLFLMECPIVSRLFVPFRTLPRRNDGNRKTRDMSVPMKELRAKNTSPSNENGNEDNFANKGNSETEGNL